MSRASPAALLLRRAGVLPVVVITDIGDAVAIARALSEGGLSAIEVTLRSANALDAITAIRREVPTILVGAGTVVDGRQLGAAEDAGAQFVVTPGTPPVLADALLEARVPVIPGAATVSELLALQVRGFDAMKLFPAEPLGGVAMVNALAGPLPGIGLCPTGGIGEAQLADYLGLPNVLCVGGSWLVRRSAIAGGDYGAVRDAARRAATVLDSLSGR